MTDRKIMDRGPPKPPLGQACNGCGYSCTAEPCKLALEYISPEIAAPCPALEFEGGRFHCGMVRRPGRYMALPNDWADQFLGPLFAQLLGVGRGCDAEDPGSA
ncbi:hypothetical protein FHR71_004247 [Methylobacterium sp. RAS18]|nr:hypothetical protein [Methylobacterium sp. RAS18]